MALFEVVEGEPLDGGQLEALYAILGSCTAVVAIFMYLVRVFLVIVVVVVVVVVICVYPSLDAAGSTEGECRVEGELEEACNRDELESAVVVYGKVGEDTDGDIVVAVVVEGVCLANDLDVGPFWELVLGWDV